MGKTAIIIGGGPAGLTAAYELLEKTDVRPLVLEKSEYLGGISRTVNYKGNRMDIGGHRFFSKSDRVMAWWMEMLPAEAGASGQGIAYQGKMREVPEGAEGDGDRVMLVRPRKSRIYYLRQFFPYPLTMSLEVVRKLGLWRMAKIGMSYARSAAMPIREEKTLEDFFINRFGRELYATFFRSYTEKVWGVPCSEISAAWGAQRIKGLSVWKTVVHALKKLSGAGGSGGVAQKGTETSLIEKFLYPKFGPGQMWEEAGRRILERGGEIRMGWTVEAVLCEGKRVLGVRARNVESGQVEELRGDYVISTAPVQELLRAFDVTPPVEVLAVSDGLVYRDFITVGILARGLRIFEETEAGRQLVRDNWIYIQEPDVQLGRLQIFNNWSPHLVAEEGKVWMGLEYFCNTTDELWRMSDAEMIALAVDELSRIGIVDAGAVEDATVIRVEKTYPAYFGTYDRFDVVREYVDGFENLFLVGRNGMHRYNNQDHSMLTAMLAVENIAAGRTDKSNLWDVNTEMEYHEEGEKAN